MKRRRRCRGIYWANGGTNSHSNFVSETDTAVEDGETLAVVSVGVDLHSAAGGGGGRRLGRGGSGSHGGWGSGGSSRLAAGADVPDLVGVASGALVGLGSVVTLVETLVTTGDGTGVSSGGKQAVGYTYIRLSPVRYQLSSALLK